MQDKPTGLVLPLLRGDIYEVNLDPTVGAEIKKKRPALIIQNNAGNEHSALTIIAPITSVKEINKSLPILVFLYRGEGGLKEDSYVHCGQIRAVDKHARLINKWGSLSEEHMKKVDEALRISLAL
jgi:mRNA interferase MazF